MKCRPSHHLEKHLEWCVQEKQLPGKAAEGIAADEILVDLIIGFHLFATPLPVVGDHVHLGLTTAERSDIDAFRCERETVVLHSRTSPNIAQHNDRSSYHWNRMSGNKGQEKETQKNTSVE